MRYRINENPEAPVEAVGQDMHVFTAVISILIGTGFVIAGLKGRQMWMYTWGAGLVLVSIAYLLMVLGDIPGFGI